MIIGLTGAHRTAKTSICEHVAKLSEIKYVKFNTIETFKRLGVDMNNIKSIKERMEVQYEIFNDYIDFIEQYKNKDEWFITDRTFIDIVAYTAADIGSFYLKDFDKSLEVNLNHMFQLADRKMKETYKVILFTRPHNDYIMEEGKPLPSKLYQEAIDIQIKYRLDANRVFHYNINGTNTLETKLDYATDIIKCETGLEFKAHEEVDSNSGTIVPSMFFNGTVPSVT